MRPLVSVILTCYNSENFVEIALRSILSQTYRNIEILICDDASTDNTRQIIDSISDSRIKKFYNEVNKGYLLSCNLLFSKAKGKYIGFQDSDDVSLLDRIQKQVDFLERNANIAFCGTNFFRKDSQERVIFESKFPEKHRDILNYVQKESNLPFCGASVIFRSEILDDIGGYRQFYSRIGYEHFDWFMLILEKYEGANLRDTLYEYRFVSNSFSRANIYSDYRKFYIRDIAFFLAYQRRRYGKDALQDIAHMVEFESYLLLLQQKFSENKDENCLILLNRAIYNNDQNLFSSVLHEYRKQQGTFNPQAYFRIEYKIIKMKFKYLLSRLRNKYSGNDF